MSLPAHWPNTNRIYKPTAINNKNPTLPALNPSWLRRRGVNCANVFGEGWGGVKVFAWASLFAFLLLSGCTSIRPIVKIGLIAPFEGLYRESGYAALKAMRQAMAECTPPGIDVLPLALDDSGDPAQAQRAAQKLLVDPTVRAIVGPFLLDAIPAVATVITPTTSIPWFIPSLVAPEAGFTDPSTSAWLDAQIDYVAANTPANRVLLLGLPTAWQLEAQTSVPVLRVDDLNATLADLKAGDAILWLGRPDVGAAWLSTLRQADSPAPFWLASQAGIDVFTAHLEAQDYAQNDDRNHTHWLLWSDSNYNQWSQLDDSAIQPNDATRYSTYRATCAALSGLVEDHPGTPLRWQLQSQAIKQPEIE